MKISVLTKPLIAILFFCTYSYSGVRYWVGGTSAPWSNTSSWSTTLGGAGGASVPGASDTVYFDGADISSAGGAQTGSISVTMPSGTISVIHIIIQNFSGANTVTFTASATANTVINMNPTATVTGIPAGQKLILQGNSTYNMTLNNSSASNSYVVQGEVELRAGTTGVGLIANSTDGKMVIGANGIVRHNHNAGGTSIPQNISWTTTAPGAQLIIQGVTNAAPTNFGGQSYANVIWNCTGQTAAVTLLSSATPNEYTTINNDFVIQSTNGQTLNLTDQAVTKYLVINRNYNQSMTSGGVSFSSSTSTLSNLQFWVRGNFTKSAGSTLTKHANPTVYISFKGSGNATITGLDNTFTTTSTNITLSIDKATTNDTVQLGGNFNPNGGLAFEVDTGTFSTSSFDMSSVTNNINLTVNANGRFVDPSNLGVTSLNLVTINGGGSLISTAVSTYGNFLITGNITCNGKINAGTTVMTSSTDRTISGSDTAVFTALQIGNASSPTTFTVTNNGIVRVMNSLQGHGGTTGRFVNGTNAYLEYRGTSEIMLNGNPTNRFTASASGNTVVYAASGSYNVFPGTYHHLSIFNYGTSIAQPGLPEANGPIVVNGNFTLRKYGTGDVNWSQAGKDSVVVAGITTIGNGATMIFGGASDSVFVDSLIIESGGTLNITVSDRFYIKGGINNNGTITSGVSMANIIFYGGTTCSITGSGSFNFLPNGIINLSTFGNTVRNFATISVYLIQGDSGTFVNESTGTVISDVFVSGSFTKDFSKPGNTVILSRTSSSSISNVLLFHHLTIRNTSVNNIIQSLWADITVNGKLILERTSTGSLTFNTSSSSLTVNDSTILNTGVNYNDDNVGGTITFNGPVVIQAGANFNPSIPSPNYNFNHNIINNGVFTLNTSATFGATTSSTIRGSLTFGGIVTVNTNLSLADATTQVQFNNSVTVNSGKSLGGVASSKYIFGGNLIVNGSFTDSANVDFTGTGAGLSGTGSFTSFGTVQFLSSFFTIQNTLSSVSLNGSTIVGAGSTIYNRETNIVVQSLNGANATSTWANAQNATVEFKSNTVMPTGILNVDSLGSVVIYSGEVAQTQIKANSYYHLKIVSPSSLGIRRQLTGNTTVKGNLELYSLSTGPDTLDTQSYDFTVDGTTTIQQYGVLFDGVAGGTLTFGGLVNVHSGGAYHVTSNTNTVFRGGITNNGTFIHGNNGTITFSTSAQTITLNSNIQLNGGTGGVNINENITLAGSGGILILGNQMVTIASGKTLNFGTGSARTVQIGTNPLTGGLNASGATIDMRNAAHTLELRSPTNSLGTLLTDGNPSTVIYNGGNSMDVFASPNYRNLSFNGTASPSTRTLIGTSLGVAGTLTIGNNITFSLGVSNVSATVTKISISSSGALSAGSTNPKILTITDSVLTTTGSIDFSSATNDRLIISGVTAGNVPAVLSSGDSLIYNRAGDQQVGVSAGSCSHLAIRGSGNKTLVSPLTVNNSFTISENAKLITTLSNLLTLGASATSNHGTSTAYVEGPMAKVGTADFVFPIGKNGKWKPLEISNISASSTFRASYEDQRYTNVADRTGLMRVSRVEYWVLDRIAGSGSARVSLHWKDAVAAGITDSSSNDLRVARWNGSTWVDQGQFSIGSGKVTSNLVSSFSPFTLGSLNGINLLGAVLTVTNTNNSGPGSLRKIIQDAVAGDTIRFDSTLIGQTINLSAGGEILWDKKLVILGLGAHNLTITTNNNGRIFNINTAASDTNVLAGLTLKNGNTSSSNGGGAIYCSSGHLFIQYCYFEGNVVSASSNTSGGAISYLSAGGSLRIYASTFYNNEINCNSATCRGGAISFHPSSSGSVSLSNCTFYKNKITGTGVRQGGAIYISNATNGALVHNTIYQNQAGNGGGFYLHSSAIADIRSNIIASNIGGDIYDEGGNLVSNGYNLIGNGSAFYSNTAGDIYGDTGYNYPNPGAFRYTSVLDPGLDSLGYHGGLVPTIPLKPWSFAIDAAFYDSSVVHDARGQIRVGGATTADIGAYEYTGHRTVVTNTQDFLLVPSISPPGSLRKFISWANGYSGRDTIHFNIAGSSPWNIYIDNNGNDGPLPAITDTLLLDATTQPGWSDGNRVILSGFYTTIASTHGLIIQAPQVEVRGFEIKKFTTNQASGIYIKNSASNFKIINNIITENKVAGIFVDSADNGIIQGNKIGIDTSSNDVGNMYGICLQNHADNILIGGTSPSERNYISGNDFSNIYIGDSDTTRIFGNYIGTNISGTSGVELAYSNSGIYAINANRVQVGGASSIYRNVISGNKGRGILMHGSDSCVIQDNYIGLNAAGTSSLPNLEDNIYLYNTSYTKIFYNKIVSAGNHGIYIHQSSFNSIVGNNIEQNNQRGIEIEGILGSANGNVIGGTFSATENIISQNGGGAIRIRGALADANAIKRNQIYCNVSYGVELTDNGNNNKTTPVIHWATPTSIMGTSSSGDSIYIYKHSGCGAIPQGRVFLGATAASGGTWSFSGSFTVGDSIVVIADSAGFSSPFSAIYPVHDPLLVTNTNNAGMGSLRNAITYANLNPSKDTIKFNISGGIGPWIINLSTLLPNITDTLMIDGFTQPNSNDSVRVRLVGNTSVSTGLNVQAPHVHIKGLEFRNFSNVSSGQAINISGDNYDNFVIERNIISGNYNGIVVDSADNGLIIGNRIGTDSTARNRFANANIGILIRNTAKHNTIGNGTFAGRNYIAGNNLHGIQLDNADSNTVHNNFIGLGIDNDTIMNNLRGISVLNSGYHQILGNVISGNVTGIHIPNGPGNNVIKRNLIGTDSTGTLGRRNSGEGIHIMFPAHKNYIGGTVNDRNIISGNLSGIYIASDSNIVEGNFIGLSKNNDTITNAEYGIYITFNAKGQKINRNVISGNGTNHAGIYDNSLGGNQIAGNYIGTDSTGTQKRPNGNYGIILQSKHNVIGGTSFSHRNIISGNTQEGIYIQADSNQVLGNFIGIGAHNDTIPNLKTGILVSNAKFVQIGGTTFASRNVISGNGYTSSHYGIEIVGGDGYHTITGNYIGTDSAGVSAFPNFGHGIYLSGANNKHIKVGDGTYEGRNIIAGNGRSAIFVEVDSASILGNFIGLNVQNDTLRNNRYSTTVGAIVLNGSYNKVGNGTFLGRNVFGACSPSSACIESWIYGVHNQILGNYIGTDSTGNAYKSNSISRGINISGLKNTLIGNGTAHGRNVIGGATQSAITLDLGADSTYIYGNYIGIGANGITPLPNASYGIEFSYDGGSRSIIGDTLPGFGNVIAYNNWGGIYINSSNDSIKIVGNSMFCNAAPITLAGGANGNKVAPTITLAIPTKVAGNTNPSDTVDIYRDTADACSGVQGKIYVGRTVANSFGDWEYNGTFNIGDSITAIATAPSFNRSSSLSVAKSVVDPLLVTTITDANVVGSLRYAMNYANLKPGKDTIRFDASLLGNEISLNYALPVLNNDSTVIYGLIDTDSVPDIIVSGDNVGADTAGFRISGKHNSIIGLKLIKYNNSISQFAILLSGDSNTVARCWIGTQNGTTSQPNGGGIRILSNRNQIRNNVISGNNLATGSKGIEIVGGDNNLIIGNIIGMDTGNTSLSIANDIGISIAMNGSDSVYNTYIGNGTLQGRNFIAGNNQSNIYADKVKGLYVDNNFIGTDTAGTVARGGSEGVRVSASSNVVIKNNVISGISGGNGIQVEGSNNKSYTIENNKIGVNKNGTSAIPNSTGISITPTSSLDTLVIRNNIISGNTAKGIFIEYVTNGWIYKNLVGLNQSGSSAIANGQYGIEIGLSVSNVKIGDTTAGNQNYISGNGIAGIAFTFNTSNSIKVVGNVIGLGKNNQLVPNNQHGILVNANLYSGSDTIAYNVVSGHSKTGIWLTSSLTNASLINIIANKIGTDTTGTLDRGNGVGIRIDGNSSFAENHRIYQNVIAYNDTGVWLNGSTYAVRNIRIRENSIFKNDVDAIKLTGNANWSISRPILSSIGVDSVLHGTVTSASNTRYVQIYVDSANNQGRIFLGYDTLNSGESAISFKIPPFAFSAFSPSSAIKVTALYDSANNTSEFSDSIGLVLSSSNPEIFVSATTLDLDTSKIGTVKMDSFYVKNLSGASLNATLQLKDSIYFGIISPTGPITLNAGDSIWVVVKAIADSINFEVIDSLYIYSNDTNPLSDTLKSVLVRGTRYDYHVVTEKLNSGFGSLRWAVDSANFYVGKDSIYFSSSLNDSTIVLTSSIYINDDSTFINGDLNSDGKPNIRIFGNGASISGIVINAKHTSLRGLNIAGFNGDGAIVIDGDSNKIISSYVGTNLSGTSSTPTNKGIYIRSAHANVIGGNDTLYRNIIVGVNAIFIDSSTNNLIIGNYIGVNSNGTVSIGTNDGVLIKNSSHNYVGNGLISGRNILGAANRNIHILNGDSNLVYGNYIGVQPNGVSLISGGGGNHSILISSTSTGNQIGLETGVGGRNIVGGANVGIYNQGLLTKVFNNFIGVGADGSTVVKNFLHGIYNDTASTILIGDGSISRRNIISGNGDTINEYGIYTKTGAYINGNYIGFDSSGLASVRNYDASIFIERSGNIVQNNLVNGSFSGQRAILLNVENSGNNLINFNTIGLDANGNIVSGNSGNGIQVLGSNSNSQDTIGNNTIVGFTRGISISSASGGIIMQANSIYSNTSEGIHIASGGNHNVTKPVITSVSVVGSDTIVSGTATGSRVQLYADMSKQGRQFIGYSNVVSGIWKDTLSPGQYSNLLSSGYVNFTALQDSVGNTSVFSDTFEIQGPKPQISFISNKSLINGDSVNGCLGDTVGFKAVVTNVQVASYVWSSLPSGFSSSSDTNTLVLTSLGDTAYVVTVTSVLGKTSTDTFKIHKFTPPVVSASFISNDTLCLGDTIKMSGSGAATYQWDIDNNGTYDYSSNSIEHKYTSSGNYTIVLRGVDSNGCVDTAHYLGVIKDTAVLSSISADTVCLGDSTTFSVSGLTSGASLMVNGVPLSSTYRFKYTSGGSHVYSVAGLLNGCTSSLGSVGVMVKDTAVLSSISADTVCLGDSTTFSVSG
ncbi:MAG: right-handed parallel beta-helix repeat-containing protein, partial [Cytophagales bacterium]|nr:right-handed parallel beta-helix repeat-containing protein [Cytophagales bacterium]MDW8384083.1 right-handed parallel beta-helix repeat-containing protein [Flammeovirgaceae bacterium]